VKEVFLMKKLFLSLPLALALGAVGPAFSPAHAAKDRDDCCCVERDGRLVCTITGEILDECCCK
jgi:hypothetical protein